MKHGLSFCSDPSYDHVRVRHLSVGRQSEANPATGLHSNGERNGLRIIVEVPVEFVETSFSFSVQSSLERVAGEIVSAPCKTQRTYQKNQVFRHGLFDRHVLHNRLLILGTWSVSLCVCLSCTAFSAATRLSKSDSKRFTAAILSLDYSLLQ